METIGKLPEKELKLVEDTFSGLVSVLRTSMVAKGLPPLSIISPASTAEQREQFRQEGKVKYPNIVINISNIAKSIGQSYNDALRRVGINSTKTDLNTYYNFRLVPIIITASLKYSSQSLAEAIEFCERWFWSEMESQFYLQNEALKINIKVTFSDDLSFPQMQFTEFGNFFYVETSLTLYTYTGRFSIRKKPKTFGINFELQNKSTNIEFVDPRSVTPNQETLI